MLAADETRKIPSQIFDRVGDIFQCSHTRHRSERAHELHRLFPAIDVDPNVLYVDNGTILTSAGAAAGFDLCLHLVRRDLGAEAAAAVARASVMPLERSRGQAQFIIHEPPTNDGTSIGRLMIWIEQNLCEDLSLPALARKAAMSVRTLSRNFRSQAGMTPAEWIARARVRSAQRLLETTRLDVEQAPHIVVLAPPQCCASISPLSSGRAQ